jgi:glycosyltransferase involved in cell wall biosynthesis
MNILYSCLSNSWGGMEMLTIIQMQQLVDRKIAVELLCLTDSKMQKEAGKKGLKCFTINSANSVNPAGITKVMSYLKAKKFDLIHSHASGDLWTVVPALKISRNKIPLILTKHVGSYIVKKDFLHKRLYNRVNLALAISNVIKTNLIETTPLTEEKIILIHNGIDINRFDPSKADREKVRSEFNIARDEVVIGTMGRFSPGKGHEEFLIAAKDLNLKNKNLKFVIVGEASYKEEAYYEKIEILSNDLGLNNIIFTGYVSDTKNILAAMDIFVFPSHAESFGLALTEAMAMELPSVSSNSDGVLDITVDNETGFLFENKNSEDMAEKINKLILSKDLREKFGKAARLRVVNKFNLHKQTDKIIEIYSEQI